MNTKYKKVSVSDRLPDDSTELYFYCNDGYYNAGYYKTEFNAFFDVDGLIFGIKDIYYWLEEVPDHEQEMREMLEKIYNIENGAFGLKSFNIEDLKRKIGRLIKQSTELK